MDSGGRGTLVNLLFPVARQGESTLWFRAKAGAELLLLPFVALITTLLYCFRARGHRITGTHTAKFDELERVDYQTLRSTIQNGDLFFCGGNYWFSRVIRFFSGASAVSHVGIVYWWNGRLMLLESVEPNGVRIVPVSQYVEDYDNSRRPYHGRLYLARDKRLNVAPAAGASPGATRNPDVEEILKAAASKLNKPFSMRDTIAFFIQGVSGRLRNRRNDEYLCSEFVAYCFKHVGHGFADDGRGFVAPEHIAASADVEALVEIQRNSS
jgi:hypothetical protein